MVINKYHYYNKNVTVWLDAKSDVNAKIAFPLGQECYITNILWGQINNQ